MSSFLIDVYSRYRASELLEGRDKDDINFVALNFSLNAHGILTNDKDISDQDELKTWKLKDAGSVITDIHKGAFSFYILSSSIREIIKILCGIIQSLWKGILAMVNGIIKLGAAILSHSSSAISKMPKELLALFGISIFAILLIKDARERTGEFFTMLWDELKKLIKSAKELVGKIWDAFKEFFKSMKPFFEGSYEVAEYLFIQSEIAMKELDMLESCRA